MTVIGHNTVEGDKLKSFVERIDRLEIDKAEIAEDIRSVYAEVKAAGFNPRAVRVIVRRQRESAEQRAARVAHEETLDQYLQALGMLGDLPLGQAAIERRRADA